MNCYRFCFGSIALLGVNAISTMPVAADVFYSDGGVHNISTVVPDRIIVTNGTTVNLFDGGSIQAPPQLDSVTVFDGSFNMFGGETSGGRIAVVGNSTSLLERGTIGVDAGPDAVGDSIVTFDNGAIVVDSGGEGDVVAAGKAACAGGLITIHGGSFSGAFDSVGRSAASFFATATMVIKGGSFDGFASVEVGSTMIVNGGTFGVDSLGFDISAQVLDDSTMEVLFGIFPGSMGTANGGHLILRGGSVGVDIDGCSVFAFPGGVVDVRGGSFSGVIDALDASIINVFGCSLDLEPVSDDPMTNTTTSLLTGILEDGTAISVLAKEVEGGQITLNSGDNLLCVDIDIKPGSDPNCFNNNGHGVIPIAILGSDSLDVREVDPLSVHLDALTVRIKGNGSAQFSFDDVNEDGFEDMVLQIQDVDTVFEPGDSSAAVTGFLFDGRSFAGTDSICVTQ